MALAAGGEGQGAVSRVLFALGVLLLAANLGGLAAERLGQPPVLGELVIGIVLASLVLLVTTIVAPAGLCWAFGRRSEGPASRAVPGDDPP